MEILKQIKNVINKTFTKIKSRYNYKKIKIKKMIGTFLLILILFISFYHNDKGYTIIENAINPIFLKVFNFNFLENINKLAHKTDFIGKISAVNHPLSKLDYIDIQIDRKEQDKLEFYLHSMPIMKKWICIKIKINGKTYPAKLKFHGTHWQQYFGNKYSYTIKLDKHSNKSFNFSRFKLIKASQADPTLISINKIAKSMGLISAHGKMKILRINDEEKGAYYFVEDIRKEFLEREFGITNYAIINSTNDNTRSVFSHSTDHDFFIGHIEKNKSIYHAQALNQFKILCENIEKNDIENVKEMFNQDYMGKYFALASIFNDVHFMTGDNLKLVYDFSSGKFYPIYRAESLGRLPEFKMFVNTFNNFNNILFHSNGPEYYNTKTNQLFKILLSDNSIRNLRDKNLNKIIQKKSLFISTIQKSHSLNEAIMLHSDESRRAYNFKKSKQINIVNILLNLADSYITYTHIYGSYDKDKHELHICQDAYSPLAIYYNKHQINSKNFVGIEFDKNLNPIDKYQIIKIKDDNFKIKNLIFINQITKGTIKNHIHFNYIDTKDSRETRSTEQMLNDNKIQYEINGNNLFIIPRTYSITSNIIIAQKYTTTIPQGVTFKIDKKINFIINGNVTIAGSKEKPVIIKNLNTKSPFGCFSIIGKNNSSFANIDYLNVSGGSESMYQGRMYTGQFNIFQSSAKISHSTFSNSHGDDGLNIKFSKVSINNCVLSNNNADQIDLDFCTAHVSNCQFISSKNDSTGDGLDLSGTYGEIEKCVFSNFLDKSLSLGEKSKVLVHDCAFLKNKNAIAVKDQTILFSWGNHFKNNQIDYYSFIKKRIFNEPVLYVNENEKKLKFKLSKKENLHYLNKESIKAEKMKMKKLSN